MPCGSRRQLWMLLDVPRHDIYGRLSERGVPLPERTGGEHRLRDERHRGGARLQGAVRIPRIYPRATARRRRLFLLFPSARFNAPAERRAASVQRRARVEYVMALSGRLVHVHAGWQANGKAGTTSCAPPTTCTDFGTICGFPGTCAAGPKGAGAADAGGCLPLACSAESVPIPGAAGPSFHQVPRPSCQCNHTCGGTTYAMRCVGTSCSCTTNATPTKSFSGTGSCNDYASCNTP